MTLRSSQPGSVIPGELKRGESILGRCVIDRRLRHDRLTAVYLARGREPGEVFTVWAAHSAVIARSERAAHVFGLEMERLTLLEHPGIPRIIAFDAAEAGPVVISARRPGSSLREIIASGSDRSARLGSKVLQGITRILEVLHSQSPPVLHRALVPERVVLDEEGEVHLEECGYLHALVTAGFVTDRTVLACSQPGYLLPEELAFPPTPALDVFSLATLLFELFTGHLPFGEASAAELSAALRGEQLPTISLHRDDMAIGVDAVFERAFGVARGEGYSTVQAFARDLLRALEPDASARLTLPGPESLLSELGAEFGLDLSISEVAEPTPSYGNYGAMLAELDARRSGASPLPESRELAVEPEIPAAPPAPDLGAESSGVASARLVSAKRTLPGGSFSLGPNAVAPRQSAVGSEQATGRESEPTELPSSALQSFDNEAIDLSSRDLQPIASSIRDQAGHMDILLADQPTQVSPLPSRERPSRATSASGLVVEPPRASPRATPAPTSNSAPSGPLSPSRLPSPGRLPSDLAPVSSLPPPVTPDAAQVFAQAARLLAVSTVIAAVCVTTGLLYIARASDELRATLRARNAESPALEIPPVAPVLDAGAPLAPELPPAVDAGLTPTPDLGAPTPPARVERAAMDASAPPSRPSVPGGAVLSRLMSTLRGPVADCVEGVEARSVTIAPRFDGATGAVVHLRLRGIFSEAPMGPCLDEAVRRVRIAPFGAPSWEPSLTFPIAPPRWTPTP